MTKEERAAYMKQYAIKNSAQIKEQKEKYKDTDAGKEAVKRCWKKQAEKRKAARKNNCKIDGSSI